MWHKSTYANCNVEILVIKVKSMMKVRKTNLFKQLYEKFVTQGKKNENIA